MRKILSILVVTLTLLSCTSEENPVIPPTEQFSIYVAKEYKADSQTIYAVLHNDDGSVLDFKEVVNDDTLKFTLPESATYHLTIHKGQINKGIKTSNLITYMDIPTGQTISLGLPTESTLISAEPDESFEVNVKHSGSIKIINICNAIGNKSNFSSVTNNVAQAKMQSNKGLDEHLISLVDKEGKSFYKTFILDKEKNNYSFDIDEFKNYDFEVQIENQEIRIVNFLIQGMVYRDNELKRAFSTSVFISEYSGIDSERYTLGYLNRYPLFETNIFAKVKNNENQSLSIASRSSAPPLLDLATPQPLQVQSKKISNFSLILPASFERWNASWLYQENNDIPIAWSIHGNTTEIPEFKLPTELVAENDQLQMISELKLSYTKMIKGKFSYKEWLLNEFVERNDPLEFQEVTWTELY